MKERPKLNLRRPLMLWSLTLAIFRCVWQNVVGEEDRNPSAWRFYQCVNGLECCTHVSLLCSIVGAMRTGFYMLHMIRTANLRDSVCDNMFYNAPVTKLWAYVFALSKAPELGEATALLTVFVISFASPSKRRLKCCQTGIVGRTQVKCSSPGKRGKVSRLLDIYPPTRQSNLPAVEDCSRHKGFHSENQTNSQ